MLGQRVGHITHYLASFTRYDTFRRRCNGCAHHVSVPRLRVRLARWRPLYKASGPPQDRQRALAQNRPIPAIQSIAFGKHIKPSGGPGPPSPPLEQRLHNGLGAHRYAMNAVLNATRVTRLRLPRRTRGFLERVVKAVAASGEVRTSGSGGARDPDHTSSPERFQAPCPGRLSRA